MQDYERQLWLRLDELDKALKGWIPRGGEESFRLYQRYVASGYVTLPRAGGWEDQPAWWIHDVDILELFDEKYWIPGEMKRVQEAQQAITEKIKAEG